MKGVPFVRRRHEKEVPFLSKMVKKGNGLDLGVEPPRIIFLFCALSQVDHVFKASAFKWFKVSTAISAAIRMLLVSRLFNIRSTFFVYFAVSFPQVSNSVHSHFKQSKKNYQRIGYLQQERVEISVAHSHPLLKL